MYPGTRVPGYPGYPNRNSYQGLLIPGYTVYPGRNSYRGSCVAGLSLRPWNSPLGVYDSSFTARSQAMMTTTEGKFVVFGGRSDNQSACLGDFHAFDLAGNEWSDLTSSTALLPSPRCDPGMATLGDKAFLFGGSSGSDLYRDLFSFDFLSHTWTSLAPMPAAFALPSVPVLSLLPPYTRRMRCPVLIYVYLAAYACSMRCPVVTYAYLAAYARSMRCPGVTYAYLAAYARSMRCPVVTYAYLATSSSRALPQPLHPSSSSGV
eukprot:2318171-Rhodomonas_salina.2